MSQLKKWIRLYFGFSRRETNGFIIMVPLILIAVFSEPIYNGLFRSPVKDFSEEARVLDSLESILANKVVIPANTVSLGDVNKSKLFPFDPNTADRDMFIELGFEELITNRIINYRNKGGSFRGKKDLQKIYGIDAEFYLKIEPYITLQPLQDERVSESHKSSVPKLEPFDLNLADSARLVVLRGIGPVLAMRIIHFREHLGGFINSSQLYEVYGVDSLVADNAIANSFIDPKFAPVRINVNLGTVDEIAAHPYISKSIAKAIVAYRNQHGPYRTVEDIMQIKIVDPDLFERIHPYFTIGSN